MRWTIKQVTEMTGISAEMLRYYEREGIISPKRLENKYRYFDDNDISILKLIIVMKRAHFSLAEIKSMERMFVSKKIYEYNEGCKDILNAKITELNQTIHNYLKVVSLMEELLSMVGDTDSYQRNERRIVEFIDRLFDDK